MLSSMCYSYLPSDADKLTTALAASVSGVPNSSKVVLPMGENIFEVDLSNIEQM